ncbi:hypothetical protein I317_04091 [Kwoniella heveanensis CBS 569]|nr:hypothetical protein I317_04091 [Kwoniella heveanensis CBS 569]
MPQGNNTELPRYGDDLATDSRGGTNTVRGSLGPRALWNSMSNKQQNIAIAALGGTVVAGGMFGYGVSAVAGTAPGPTATVTTTATVTHTVTPTGEHTTRVNAPATVTAALNSHRRQQRLLYLSHSPTCLP